MRRRLSLRLWVAGTVLVVLALAALTLGVGITVHQNANRATRDAERFIMGVLADADRWHDPDWQSATRAEARQLNVDLTLFDSQGRAVLMDAAGGLERVNIRPGVPMTVTKSMSIVMRYNQGDLAGTLTWALRAQPAANNSDLLVIGGALVVILLLCLAAGWWIGFWVIRPLLGLSRAAEQLAQGDMAVALPSSPVKEVQGLIDTFGLMTGQLRQAGLRQSAVDQERRLLISAISHDLRTPLFSLRAHLEGIQSGLAGTPDKQAHYLANALNRVANMERLIADLLAYSKLEYLEQSPAPERLDLGEYIASVAQGAIARGEAKGVAVVLQPPAEKCWVQADPNLLWRVFDNLLDNAIRHTPPGGSIHLRWEAMEGRVQVSVEDSGPGIADADLPHLFTPLFQGDRSRSGQFGGSAGLGLAIAQRVAAAHGGSIVAGNRPKGGACFTVVLPRPAMVS